MRTADETSAEVRALWTAVFGEPPKAELQTAEAIEALVAKLPLPKYDTLLRDGVTSPFEPRLARR